ncbi:hypothetical protein PR003_g20372 [Phytophthora rubi]|nr:hypothetical protein PR002_g14649 [Phytophthora rubi]KAE9309995.1 hypothetical protein PR003_g20372 [Phytophthora rubi]
MTTSSTVTPGSNHAAASTTDTTTTMDTTSTTDTTYTSITTNTTFSKASGYISCPKDDNFHGNECRSNLDTGDNGIAGHCSHEDGLDEWHRH